MISARGRTTTVAVHTRTKHYTQCRIKAGAADAAALRPFTKQAHGRERENEKTLPYFGSGFSGWYNFGEKH